MTTLGKTTDPTLERDSWTPVCRLTDLVRERGAAALVAGRQVALVRTHDDDVLAVQQLDPYSEAHIMARGIVGTRGDSPTITSPMYKQVFDLGTGDCLDPAGEEPIALLTWPTRVVDGAVLVRSVPSAAPAVRSGARRAAA